MPQQPEFRQFLYIKVPILLKRKQRNSNKLKPLPRQFLYIKILVKYKKSNSNKLEQLLLKYFKAILVIITTIEYKTIYSIKN